MDTKYSIMMITTPNKESAKELSKILLLKKLVACVNIIGPINSLYTWEDSIQEDSEFLLICKTKDKIFQSHIVDEVIRNHPYDIPEIICLPVNDGNQTYLNWIDQVTLDL